MVGVWAGCIALGTLNQIAKQTNAGTIAANTAKQSADTGTGRVGLASFSLSQSL
jgi:hypothetical protein